MTLMSVDAALSAILSRISPLGAERVGLLEAVGRVLAEPVRSTRRLPAWDNSAMDGYAVRAADLTAPGTTLPIAQAVAAGDLGETPLLPGHAARIFTGAPMPPGADTVVMQEDTEASDAGVRFRNAARRGDNVRKVGSDVESGQTLLEMRRTLTPGDVALLAAQGRLSASVFRRPTVAIVSSGNELVEIDAGEPGRGQIANSNAWALAAAVAEAGGLPRLLPIVRDSREATELALTEAARSADVVLTTGGVSVGDHDHVGPTLKALCGDRFAFWKVAIRPGKPLIFGMIGGPNAGCAAFGLPGNPISALVTFEVFVRPALLRMQGLERCLRRPVIALTRSPLPASGPRTEYLRARMEYDASGQLWVRPVSNQGSGALSSLAGADALVIRPTGAPATDAGGEVRVLLLGPDAPETRLEGPETRPEALDRSGP